MPDIIAVLRIVLVALVLFSFWIGPRQTAHAQSPASIAEIQVRNTSSKSDDFLCWSPVKSRARLLSPAQTDIDVTLQSLSSSPIGGAVGFFEHPHFEAPAATELRITLKKDGSWTDFYVAGLKSSSGNKDVSIRAILADGKVIANDAVMVRVRKNAEKLTSVERNNFLSALAKWKARPGQTRKTRYEDFYTAHKDAFDMGIHSNFGRNVSNFLPWHRAFLLNFERELQEIDPTVSLPYWRFDAPAPKLFSPDFIGNLEPGSSEVQFNTTNLLFGWSKDGVSLRRFKVFPNGPAVPANILGTILCLSNDPACNNPIYRATTDAIEMNYHNNAHASVLGWLGGADSPSDPLFYLLHANVDRAWAHWQATYRRFIDTGADAASYTPVGTYPGSLSAARLRKGLYALDEMWPWSRPSAGDDEQAKWMPYAFLFPASESLPIAPDHPPIPARMIDYLGVHKLENAHGVCYDDINYQGKVIGN